MSLVERFHKATPFPDNVPVAELTRLSIGKLLAHDPAESEQLFRACRNTGFFLIDLRESEQGETMLRDAENMFVINEKVHEIDEGELAKYAFKPPGDIFGYKRTGVTKVEDGSPDQVEFYSISEDDVLGKLPPRGHPELIESNRSQLEDFVHHARDICGHIMSHLDTHLSLKSGTLASLNPPDQPSGTNVRLLKSLASPHGSFQSKLAGHTDIGSITMLFNVLGGLQMLPPGSENVPINWRYIRPQPGCAIINLGDAMVRWSGGILRSNMHRIATPPGEQVGCTRYSVGYFLRPAGVVSMKRLQGDVGATVIPRLEDGEEDGEICAKEWERLRVQQISNGENRPELLGGSRLAVKAH